MQKTDSLILTNFGQIFVPYMFVVLGGEILLTIS